MRCPSLWGDASACFEANHGASIRLAWQSATVSQHDSSNSSADRNWSSTAHFPYSAFLTASATPTAVIAIPSICMRLSDSPRMNTACRATSGGIR